MRYFIGFLVTVGLLILLIIILVGGGGKKAEVPKTNKSFYDYSNTNAEVKLTASGPINYDGDHQQVQIIVSQNTVVYNQIRGYDGQVTKGQSFPNNEAAFSNFLHALYRVGFTTVDTNPDLKDERGYCPQGNRYVFELVQEGHSIERAWVTSCGGTKTYLGQPSTTLQLFQAQVPNYQELAGSTNYNFF